MGAVDDPAVVRRVGIGLSPQFEAEVFDDIGWGPGQRLRDAGEIRDNGLDAITFALDFRLQALHLVAVERVGDILHLVSGKVSMYHQQVALPDGR